MLKKILFYVFIFLFKTDSKKGHGIQLLVLCTFVLLISASCLFYVVSTDKIINTTATIIDITQREDERGNIWFKPIISFNDTANNQHISSIGKESITFPSLEINQKINLYYRLKSPDTISTNINDIINHNLYYIISSIIFLSVITLLIGINIIIKNKNDRILWEFHPYRDASEGPCD